MCGGGGNAAAAQQQQDAQNQAQISGNVAQINNAFNNRAPQYQQYLNATRNLYDTELNRQQGIASRNLKFALARNGQTGGSVAADQGDELGREFAQGTITAEQKAQGALSSLENQDQAERLQMISLAQSGGDIGNAANETTDALQSNLGAAMSGQTASSLGSVFGDLSNNYQSAQNAALTRKGLNNSAQYVYGNQAQQATGTGGVFG